ncbi:MAG: DUF3987 domain-containing protein [Planctomycetia bacterium]|nr:DUF3987 domain-containing protein [Planctomycetia bacterium]
MSVPKQSPRLKAASDLAIRGLHIVPIHPIRNGKCSCPKGSECNSPGKHPMTGHGLDEASADSIQISKWWANVPDANIAIRTGSVSGIWVLDADGAEGIAAIEQLESKYGPLPSTPTVRTGGGGRHYYFKDDLFGDVIKNATKLGGHPVDVRGNDGYVLAPPSNHISGKDYTWEQSLNHVSIAPPPPWLLAIVTKKIAWPNGVATIPAPQPTQPTKQTAGAVEAPTLVMPSVERRILRIREELNLETAAGVPEGQRHDRALELVGAHLGRGEDAQQVKALALGWAARCTQPMPPEEVERIVDDLAAKQQASAAGAACWESPVAFHDFAVPSFPTACLTAWLRVYVEAVAQATQTPCDMVAMLALAAVAAALAKKVEIVVTEGYREPVNLFTVTAMPPGSRKSAVFAEVTAPLLEYEESEIQRLKPVMAKAKTEREIQEARLDNLKSAVVKGKPEEQAKLTQDAGKLAADLATTSLPSLPRLIASDTTPERLGTLLHDHGGRMAVLSPEGDVFDLMAGRYSGKGMPNFGVYLNGHAGDDLRVDRVARTAEFVHRPALTLGLVVQPDVIRGLADKPGFHARGLLGRFLYCMPKSLIGQRKADPSPVPALVRDTYHKNMLALLKLTASIDNEKMEHPHLLQLSPEARQKQLSFAKRIEPMLDESCELGSMADWGAKLVGAVARIAGQLHMAEHVAAKEPWAVPVSEATMEHAITIGEYLIPHARAAYAQMGADPVIEEAKFVLRWLQRKQLTTVTEREVFEGTKGRFKRVEHLRPALGVLVNHGYLHQQAAPARTGAGRRPSPAYQVNPACYSHNSHNSQNGPPPIDSANTANNANGVLPATATFEEGAL